MFDTRHMDLKTENRSLKNEIQKFKSGQDTLISKQSTKKSSLSMTVSIRQKSEKTKNRIVPKLSNSKTK